MLCGDVAEGHGVAQGQAGGEEGIVAAAEELAAQVAHGVQPLNGSAVFTNHHGVGVGENTGGDGGAADVTADAPEGSGLDLVQELGVLAEVGVITGIAQLIVVLDAGQSFFLGQAQLFNQLFQSVGAEGVDEVGEHAHMILSGAFLHVLLHGNGGYQHGHIHVVHVVVVIDLAVPALGAGFLVLMIHVLTLEAGLPAQLLGDVGHFHGLVGEALALHVQEQVGIVPHEACIEVVHNGGVGHGLHHAAGQDSQDVAVAGAVVDLLVEGFGVGAEAANHGGVILVCAGGQDDGLGVDLHESTGGILADTAHHGAVLLDQLDNGGGVVDIQHVAVLLGGVVQDAGDQSAEVVGLGAEPGGEDLHLVLAEVPALGAVHPDAGEHGVGGLVDLHAGLLVLVAQLAFQAALLAEEPQGIFGILNVSVDQPGIASPSIGGDAHILPAGDAAGGGAALDNGGSAVALGVGDGLLLQHHDLLALVQRLHGSHDTGSTGTADHDVAVDLLGEVLDLPHHHGGGVHILGDEVGGDKGALGGQNLLDVAVNDGSAALGLGDALLQAGLGSIGGDGGGGNAVDVGALGTQQLLDDGVLGGLTDGGGLLGQIQVDGDDAVGIKDRGHLHGAHALGGGGVGAGGVDSLRRGFPETA